MKNSLLFLFGFFFCVTPIFSQSEKDCKKTCTIDKVVYEKAYLGVQFGGPCGRETEKGVIILNVLENTAADVNKLLIEDVVLSINNIEVNKMVEAKKIIASHKPFDTLEFKVLSEGRTLTKNIKLGYRNSKKVQEEVCCDSFNLEENIVVYPNPASVNLNIEFKTAIEGNYDFEIFNLNGVRFYDDKNYHIKNQLIKTINVEKLEDGVYVLKIKQGSKTHSSMFVVKK
ncbi:T9SS type A sorting domain-containing protein [Oceanihabitans sp. 2_MG-2023]|uniref:T9SS type A sorting domain-containing protein n=1 Tax=Oceanihabitans sp. 2_MG-2023 TaxID=3062661 RepID=UPI0026E48758|nr:T9SS type A sorting domain-containing protein [Oceanihabitans sp. 2_MG-2023]MDO6595462.1 T9SS type A sorting domain-containing protein [Oceanihabitans sp. 2_MG-2023]